ncbi:MAG: hypothetical protein PWQ12_1913 [Clostridiales bacterium]|jgi:D-alanyl-D-alanine carboxypeptidase (penicillin-binding protein 5/6)|nr:hypothetical protein [Clostridiales bacterium]
MSQHKILFKSMISRFTDDRLLRAGLSIFLLITLLFPYGLSFAEGETTEDYTPKNLVADGAILINASSGQVLFEKNSQTPLYPASTTKILTAIICLEDLNLSDVVTVDDEAPYVGGSHIALDVGEQLTVEQLLYALLMASANDAAVALAKYHSGSVEAFAEVMNERAAEMGATHSNFTNPHGLTDPDHVTTAYDLAKITQYALKNQKFNEIIQTRRYEIPPTNKKNETRYLNSSNSFFPGMSGSDTLIDVDGKQIPIEFDLVDGVKRGYTEEALNCFVGSATLDGRRYISVVLHSRANDMYADTRKLLNYGLYGFNTYHLADAGTVAETFQMDDKNKTKLSGLYASDVIVDLPVGTSADAITPAFTLLSGLELPVSEGEVIGNASITLSDGSQLQTPLLSDGDYIGADLLTEDTTYFLQKKTVPEFFLWLLPHLLFAVLIWRTVMTLIRLRSDKRRSNKKRKKAVSHS